MASVLVERFDCTDKLQFSSESGTGIDVVGLFFAGTFCLHFHLQLM